MSIRVPARSPRARRTSHPTPAAAPSTGNPPTPAAEPAPPLPGSAQPGADVALPGLEFEPPTDSETEQGPVDRGASLTARLGVVGWSRLDPLLLAALAIRAPVLLVGEHGTAKTLLAERVARALGSEFRHYNASLLNYDDLVGIPLPDAEGRLRFVGTAGAVWDAEFVFFDEVNRCRPDLQNKLFPIVHERRVAGQDLPRLEHRWAAMNPPPDEDDPTGYLGAEPLDDALADRFWFVIRVPDWGALSRDERLRLAAGAAEDRPDAPHVRIDGPNDARTTDRHDDSDWLAEQVAGVARGAAEAERLLGPQLSDWAVTLTDLLRGHGLTVSPRRVRILVRAAAATHAAAAALGAPTSLSDTLELVALNALPAWAEAVPPAVLTVVGAHTQAWELAEGRLDPVLREVLAEPDVVERIRVALRTGASEPQLARTVTGALAAQPTKGRRAALGLVLSRALAEHPLTPAAWGAVAEQALPLLTPGEREYSVRPGPALEAWRSAGAGLAAGQAPGGVQLLSRALVNGCGPVVLAAERDAAAPDELLQTFRRWCAEFGVTA